MITKRLILKNTLIGVIVLSVGLTVYVILPEFMDLSNQEMIYQGHPTYACTEPFKVQSCLNKTRLNGYQFSNNGLLVTDIGFKLNP